MNIKKIVIYLASLVLAGSIFTSQAYAAQLLDKVIAVVNDDVISQYELDNYTKIVVANMQAQGNNALPSKDVLQEQVLNRMILDKIQVQLAEQSGIEADSIMVSEAIQHIARQQNKNVEGLKQSIEEKGIKFDDFRQIVRNDLLVQRVQAREVAQDVVIAKSDVESFLSSPAGQDQSGTEYKLSHILLLAPESPTPSALKKVQNKAEELVTSLQQGADFHKTAMSQSSGRQALNGGDLGWRTTGELPTIFVNYVPTMKVGDIVGPIRSASGFHIIKLTDKRTSNDASKLETHVRQILIVPDSNTSSDEAKAILTSLRQQLIKGADFAKLAQKKSQDVRSAAKGGDIGWVHEKVVLPKFYEVMAKLRNNEISEPFQTDEGWYLIQVLDRRNQLTSDEAAWNRAVEVLTMRKTNEAIEAWTKRIRDEARVNILLPNQGGKQSTT